jgi:hypothetical protein
MATFGGQLGAGQEFLVDTYLTNMAQGFERTLTGAVAYRVATPVPVMLQTGKFPIFSRGDWFRDQAKTRPLGGEVELITYGAGEGTYNAQEYGLADILSLQHGIRRDRFFSTQAMVPGVWGVTRTGVASGPTGTQFLKWSDDASKPYDDIESERERIALATGFRPNVLALGAATYLRLRRHPQLTGLLGANQPKIVTDDLMKAYFEVDDLVVARAVYNNGLEGAADSFQYTVNTNCALLLYRNPTPAGVATRTAVAIFGWNGLLPGQTNEDGTVMGWFRIPRAYSDQLDARSAWDMKILDASLGVFFDQTL